MTEDMLNLLFDYFLYISVIHFLHTGIFVNEGKFENDTDNMDITLKDDSNENHRVRILKSTVKCLFSFQIYSVLFYCHFGLNTLYILHLKC
jgi:hypothetical protein